ncbi:28S ribosomal protein S9, mitochondrial isoform X2 [Cyprinus carpio]|uniref:28S ribosomal protein S9, mitochondrial isoform X2 n=1 Tax=Cyprinus carpio TaxID=7962 RepID=A0A9Q9Y643_CYPCA|nr:28S ribosomal protein S9, mitochondrial isoform X2 [Cyprinus carpio]
MWICECGILQDVSLQCAKGCDVVFASCLSACRRANMAASGCRGVRSILWKYGSYGNNLFVSRSKMVPQLPLRQIYVASSLWKKNLAAAGPQKFTQEFIDKQVEEFEVGKRHLANMMGEDPETFTQEDIDRSIAYLFPSGLFEKRARPVMKHPEEIFPKQTAIQWDAEGRPFHFLFYTGKQSYYSLLHDVYEKILAIERHQDKMRNKGLFTSDTKQILLTGSRWLLKEEIEENLVENISVQDYMRLIQLMELLLSMPYCSLEEEFILKFRKQLEVQSSKYEIPALQYDPQGVAFSVADGRRKSAKASITLRDSGSGNITINGRNYLHYFPVLQNSWPADRRPQDQGEEETRTGGSAEEVHLEKALNRKGSIQHRNPERGHNFSLSLDYWNIPQTVIPINQPCCIKPACIS